MKLVIENIGRIRGLEMEVRPLTVLIGPNQSGKTTIAHALYAAASGASLLRIPEQVERELTAAELRELVIAGIGPTETRRLARFFQDRTGVFGGGRASLVYTRAEVAAVVDGMPPWRGLEDPDAPVKPPRRSASGRPPKYWRPEDVAGLCRTAGRRLGPRLPIAIPAERSGLVLTYKVLAARRFRMLLAERRERFAEEEVEQTADVVASSFGEPRFAEPLEEFLDFLVRTEGIAIGKRFVRHTPRAAVFESIASRLEAALLGSQRLEWRPAGLGGAELRLRLDEERTVDLHLASGALKNIAPLLLWLRGYRGDLLVVDEPELGLHPIAQAKVLEALAMVARSGVRVFVTTHSAAIVTHLNNLLVGQAEPEARQRQAELLYLKDAGAFLGADEVGAYEVADGRVRDLKDPDFGVRWDTLGEGIEELTELYFRLKRAGEGLDGRE